MNEIHEREQYFFDEKTIDILADFIMNYNRVCCLCCPTLGEELVRRGKTPTILDIDNRFNHLPGFKLYDICSPDWIYEKFDLIICDPPFFTVPLLAMKSAICQLSNFDPDQPLIITYLKRRASKLVGVFNHFGLTMRRGKLLYNTVVDSEKNDIRIFSNIKGNHIFFEGGVL